MQGTVNPSSHDSVGSSPTAPIIALQAVSWPPSGSPPHPVFRNFSVMTPSFLFSAFVGLVQGWFAVILFKKLLLIQFLPFTHSAPYVLALTTLAMLTKRLQNAFTTCFSNFLNLTAPKTTIVQLTKRVQVAFSRPFCFSSCLESRHHYGKITENNCFLSAEVAFCLGRPATRRGIDPLLLYIIRGASYDARVLTKGDMDGFDSKKKK